MTYPSSCRGEGEHAGNPQALVPEQATITYPCSYTGKPQKRVPKMNYSSKCKGKERIGTGARKSKNELLENLLGEGGRTGNP